MREISRIELYSWIYSLWIDKKHNDNTAWIMDMLRKSFEEFEYLLDLNIKILSNIEPNFLAKDGFNRKFFDKESFLEEYSKNIRDIQMFAELGYLNYEKFEKFTKKIVGSSNEYYAFNALINLLNQVNNRIIDQSKLNLFGLSFLYDEKLNIDKYGDAKLNKVFLSHAFDDKLYTLCLFIYMLQNGIFLYVDWLFCNELKNGTKIKENLNKELSDSIQLLFLRSINSEFTIRGSGNIRGWCSWELGSFYSIDRSNQDSKFYIELYQRGEYSNNNLQMDGIKPLTGISFGLLK